MKYKLWFLVFILVFFLSGCNKNAEKTEFLNAEPPTFENSGENEFDVLELTFKDNTPVYSDLGDVKEGKYYLNEDNKIRYLDFTPEYVFNSETRKFEKTGLYVCTLPWRYKNRLRSKETETHTLNGIVVFARHPFLIYIDKSDGKTYAKCLLSSFDSYFNEDRSYVDFINFAVNYEPAPYNPIDDTTSK